MSKKVEMIRRRGGDGKRTESPMLQQHMRLAGWGKHSEEEQE